MTKKPIADAKVRSSTKTPAEDAPADKPKVAKPAAAKSSAPRVEAPAAESAAAAAPDIELHMIEIEAAEDGEPDEVIIRERAYAIWVEEGHPHGRDEEHWRRARDEVGGKNKSRSRPKPRSKA